MADAVIEGRQGEDLTLDDTAVQNQADEATEVESIEIDEEDVTSPDED